MLYFLSTNIKEKRGGGWKKRGSWRAGEEGEESQSLLQKLQFLSKTCHWHLSPQKTFCHAHTSVYDSRKINLGREASPQSSCDGFSDVLINHADNEVANCCLMAKLKRQLPQWVSMNMSKDCPTGSLRRFSETFLWGLNAEYFIDH